MTATRAVGGMAMRSSVTLLIFLTGLYLQGKHLPPVGIFPLTRTVLDKKLKKQKSKGKSK